MGLIYMLKVYLKPSSMPLARHKLVLPNARKRRPELPPVEPAMVPPLLARGPSVSLTRQVARDINSSFLFETLDPCVLRKVDLQGWRRGLSRLLGKMLTYIY